MWKLLQGDNRSLLPTLPDGSVQCVVTSPPYYGLRDYGVSGQIGLEASPEEYVDNLVQIFRQVRRVLAEDGTLWLNLGDSYWGGKGKSGYELPAEAEERRAAGQTLQAAHMVPGIRDMRPTDGKHASIKPKDLVGIPWMVAFALRADGWYLRQDLIWDKPNPMPESVKDRCTKSHEYIFLLTKSRRYYYDLQAILEPAHYDGRQQTKMKGSEKYQNGFAPTQGNSLQTVHTQGHERWTYRLGGRTERKMEGTGYGGDGKGLHGHSGYYDGNGNPRFHQFPDGAPARNKRSVWRVATKPYPEAHFATYPPALIEPCILAGSREGDVVLDPFNGSGTTGEVALRNKRGYIGMEINPDYIQLSRKRLLQQEGGEASQTTSLSPT